MPRFGEIKRRRKKYPTRRTRERQAIREARASVDKKPFSSNMSNSRKKRSAFSREEARSRNSSRNSSHWSSGAEGQSDYSDSHEPMFAEGEQNATGQPHQSEGSKNAPGSMRPEAFDLLIGFLCSPEQAEHAYQDLDYMWEHRWSVKYPGWRAHFISLKNAVSIALGGLASRLMKIGVISAAVGAVRWMGGHLSL